MDKKIEITDEDVDRTWDQAWYALIIGTIMLAFGWWVGVILWAASFLFSRMAIALEHYRKRWPNGR